MADLTYQQKLNSFDNTLQAGRELVTSDPLGALQQFRKAQEIFPTATGFEGWFDYLEALIQHREDFYQRKARSARQSRSPEMQEAERLEAKRRAEEAERLEQERQREEEEERRKEKERLAEEKRRLEEARRLEEERLEEERLRPRSNNP